jgi:hypothetical protein
MADRPDRSEPAEKGRLWRRLALVLALLGLGLVFVPRLAGEPLRLGSFTLYDNGWSANALALLVIGFIVIGWTRRR